MPGQALKFGAVVAQQGLERGDVIGDRLQVEHLFRGADVGRIHGVLDGDQCLRARHLLQLGDGQPHFGGDVLHPVLELAATGGREVTELVLYVLEHVSQLVAADIVLLGGIGKLLHLLNGHPRLERHLLQLAPLLGQRTDGCSQPHRRPDQAQHGTLDDAEPLHDGNGFVRQQICRFIERAAKIECRVFGTLGVGSIAFQHVRSGADIGRQGREIRAEEHPKVSNLGR